MPRETRDQERERVDRELRAIEYGLDPRTATWEQINARKEQIARAERYANPHLAPNEFEDVARLQVRLREYDAAPPEVQELQRRDARGGPVYTPSPEVMAHGEAIAAAEQTGRSHEQAVRDVRALIKSAEQRNDQGDGARRALGFLARRLVGRKN